MYESNYRLEPTKSEFSHEIVTGQSNLLDNDPYTLSHDHMPVTID
jgi:hypothetical protein